jgi:hypothetical protein
LLLTAKPESQVEFEASFHVTESKTSILNEVQCFFASAPRAIKNQSIVATEIVEPEALSH